MYTTDTDNFNTSGIIACGATYILSWSDEFVSVVALPMTNIAGPSSFFPHIALLLANLE